MPITVSQLEAAVVHAWTAQGTQHDRAHDLAHLRRVWAAAQHIALAEPEPVDHEVLLAAAFLHDLVNVPKDSPERALASRWSADEAVRLLPSLGIDAHKLDAVHHAIHAHSFSANVPPHTREAMILQDADRLEALGAIGLARMFYVSGVMQRALFDAQDPLAEHRPLDDREYALDHLEVKLFRIADTLHTAAARRMASERVAFMRAFRDQLLSELA